MAEYTDPAGRGTICVQCEEGTDGCALLAHCRALEAERERLLNLVRYCRHQLHDENLITDDEFAALLEEGSAAKLETYDELRAQLREVEAERDSFHKIALLVAHPKFENLEGQTRYVLGEQDVKKARKVIGE